MNLCRQGVQLPALWKAVRPTRLRETLAPSVGILTIHSL